jgi:hypothetical protein
MAGKISKTAPHRIPDLVGAVFFFLMAPFKGATFQTGLRINAR